jgi:hypothetical protein
MNEKCFTLSFHARGECYRPSKIVYAFAVQHDVGVLAKLGRYRGKPYPYGASEIRVSNKLKREQMVPALVASVVPVLPSMKEMGANCFQVSAAYRYDAQCNLEFSQQEMALLASLDCPFCLSCYRSE